MPKLEELKFVEISTPGEDDGHLALATPQVVLEIDGVYYITFACWAYDPHQEGLTHEERASIDKVRDLFKDGGKVEARMLPPKDTIQPMCSAHADEWGYEGRCKPPTPTSPPPV